MIKNDFLSKRYIIDNKLWIIATLIFILEFFLFSHSFFRNIVNCYPSNFDQGSYLSLAYYNYNNIKQHGLVYAINHYRSLPTGFLFPIQAVLFFLLVGASRFTALSINFIYFILLQFATLKTIKTLTSSDALSLILLGLLLSLGTTFLPGGITDFRIDFIAMCLFGLIVTSVIKSKIFLDKRWTLITGILIFLSILLRYITLVYWSTILLFSFIGLMLYKISVSKDDPKYADIQERCRNLLLLGSVIAGIILVYFYIFHEQIYSYYVVGHITGKEKYIRMSIAGVNSLLSDLMYYPNIILSLHINFYGSILFAINIFFIIVFTAVYLFKPNGLNKQPINSTEYLSYFREACCFILLSIIIPVVFLTIDDSKSTIVGGVVVVSILWLIMFVLIYFYSKGPILGKWTKLLFNVLAIISLSVGLFNQVKHFNRHNSKRQTESLKQITKMYDDIGNYAMAEKLTAINVSFDRIVDYLSSGVLTTLYYERHGIFLNVINQPMGGSIFTISKQQAIASIAKSNVVIINMGNYTGSYPYPFDKSMDTIRPELRAYLKYNFKVLGDYSYDGAKLRVYVAH